MRVVHGTVVEGKVVIEGEPLEDGTEVVVVVGEPGTFDLTAEEEAVLVESLQQIAGGELIDGPALLRELAQKRCDVPAPPRAQIVRAETGATKWEVAARPLPERLRPYVVSCMGYAETSHGPCRRRELPGPRIVVILETGPPIRVYASGAETHARRFPGGFVAGLDDTWTLTEHDGHQSGVQLDLTPLGARMIFGLPMSELTGRALPFTDLVTREERGLCERLAEARSWDERLDAVEALVTARLARARLDARPVAWAARQIAARGGAVEVRALARELGVSHKHLIALFRDQVGVTPKRLARLVRFERVTQRLKSGPPAAWAELALELGYADQSHLAREVRGFTGLTPTGTRALLDASGFPALFPG